MKYLWDPFKEIKELDKTFNKLMKKTFLNQIREPISDIIDKKDKFEIQCELPGLKKNDIEITADNESIEIKAKKSMEKEEKKKDYFMKERSYSGFYRMFKLPEEINPEKIKCEYKDGLLIIELPKKTAKKKKIIKIN